MKQATLPGLALIGALSFWLPCQGAAPAAKAHHPHHSAQPPAPTYRVIVPTSEKAGQTWKYTTRKPPKNWYAPGFNDNAWKTGKGGFGTRPPGSGPVGTVWKNTPGDIWLRRSFNPGPLTAAQIGRLVVRDYHDEDIDVYVNGVAAYSAPGYVTTYEDKPLSLKARQSLHPNAANEMAVHCRQTRGGQYVDVGLAERMP